MTVPTEMTALGGGDPDGPVHVAGYAVDDRPVLPPKRDYGIGIVGCGGIVNYAHLPAYKAHSLNVRACYDRKRSVAERLATDHGIPWVADDLDALLEDETIQILDIAVPPWAQAEVALRAIAAGKHLLCQKPLSDVYADAANIVAAAHRARVKLAVNQQMRWDAGIRVSRQLIDQGALGEPVDARIEVSVSTPWRMWPWIAQSERLEVMYHSIHYLDCLRYLFGDPVRVSAAHHRWPGQPEAGETRTTTILDYGADLVAIVDVNHHNWSDDAYAVFRFLGTEGIIKGTLGLLYDYPDGRVDTLSYQPRAEPRRWYNVPLSTRWIPDAFIGPMASLMDAIQTGGEPTTSGADNLGTLRLVFATYRAASEGRAVEPGEIAAAAAVVGTAESPTRL